MRTIYTLSFDGSDKVYVGQTIRKLSARFSSHKTDLRMGRHHNKYLLNAFRKHGEKALKCDFIEEHEDEAEGMDAERFFIKYLKFLGVELYNLSEGGESNWTDKSTEKRRSTVSGRPLSERQLAYFKRIAERAARMTPEERSAIWGVHKGKKFTPEHKKKRAEGVRKFWSDKYRSAARRASISNLFKGRVLTPEHESAWRGGLKKYHWKRRLINAAAKFTLDRYYGRSQPIQQCLFT